MKLWKGLAIYPKIIENKSISQFTQAEKKRYTKTGLRWYVYFSYFNPDAGLNGKFEKHLVPTYGINRDYPSFDARYKAIHRLFEATKELLEDGHTPLEITVYDNKVLTVDKALDYALSNKKLTVGKDTYNNYVVRVNQFKRFLQKKKLIKRDIGTFNFRVTREYLKEIAEQTSVANRNNVLRTLKAIFSNLYENDIIKENYVAKIKFDKTKNERFKSYSHKQATDILKHLDKTDPIMALFVKFIGYNFLRPKEVVRLKVGDLDMENKLLSVFVKQGRYKTKRIPDDIIDDLSKYKLDKPDHYLFALNSISGKWDRDERGRREHFSKKYTKVKKELGFGEGYVLYSFRHTYITIGYKNLRKRMSKDDALDTLMGYTGHESRDSLQKYIHYVDAEIVDEYDGEVK